MRFGYIESYLDNRVDIDSDIMPMVTVMMVNGKPTLNHWLKVSLKPYFALIPAATTPALEPISVRFPPKSAPRASTHHRGLMVWCPNPATISVLFSRFSNSGVIVTV